MGNLSGMEIVPRLADHARLIANQADPGDLRLVEPLCADLPDLARWMALPVGLSIFLWGCLLIAVFT
ncbi:MAG: hypothetical protein ACK4IC_05115 [Erythrobacter sp.]